MMAKVEPIAVIGIGCRLPGDVNNPEDLWRLLSEGRTGLTEIPKDRWNADSWYHPDPEAREALNTKKGYFLKQDVSEFDARFFGFSTAEAEQTDPQQRLLLETTYEALENAGVPLATLKGSDTSVFVAVFARDYDRMTWKDPPQVQKHTITGNGEAILAARISYVFDLRGGAMTLDTGCSGSMVAIHQACLSLRSGESRMAIAGGTELLLHPDQFVPWSFNGMANPEGQCFAFDSRGAGYGRGEGVGTVILKRLDHAIRDGDPIHSVILNSGINQDGKTAGILLPNPTAQATLVKQVYESAGLNPAHTLYVEAHGTGTQAGDQAEIYSISDAICGADRKHPLIVGSVKANIGHLEASSGIAGFIKAVMVLKKGQVPPQPNFITEKPGLKLSERGIKIPTELTTLLPNGYTGPYRVSVSSYGYGGTNAHLVLEAPNGGRALNGCTDGYSSARIDPQLDAYTNGHTRLHANGSIGRGISTNSQGDTIAMATPTTDRALPFPLSTHVDSVFTFLLGRLARWMSMSGGSYTKLQDLSFTLCSRKSALRHRGCITASSWEELKSLLTTPITKTRAAPSTTMTFVFTGQGAQWYGMGRELIGTSEVFRASLNQTNMILASLGCQWDLFEELGRTQEESRIGTGELAQPATTAIQIALVDLFASLGIRPNRVIGHSSGEIAAAYAAGRLDRVAAMQVAFYRGLYSAQAKHLNPVPGAMLAVAAGEKTVASMLKIVSANGTNQLTIACVNSPESVTVSGDAMAIKELERMMDLESGVPTRRLQVDTAYHSHHMEKVAGDYLKSLDAIQQVAKPKSEVTFYSSVTGMIKDSEFGAAYWTQNLVSQVRFSAALQTIAADLLTGSSSQPNAANMFLEIGPHSALQGPIRQTLCLEPDLKYTYCPSLVRKKDAGRAVLATVGKLWELGFKVDLRTVLRMQGTDPSTLRCLSDLPTYPWDHSKKYWRESRLSRDHRLRQHPYHDLLGLLDVMSPLNEPRWRYHLSVDRLPWLYHHVVERQVIWPGTGYLCMVIEAMKQLVHLRNPNSKIARISMKDFEVKKAVVVPSEQFGAQNSDVEVQLVLSSSTTSEGSPWESVRILSALQDGPWAQNFSGLVKADVTSTTSSGDHDWTGLDEREMDLVQSLDHLERIRSLAKAAVDPVYLYSNMREAGNDFGPSFTLLTEVFTGKRVGFAKMAVPDMNLYMPGCFHQPHTLHPAVLDVPNHVMGLLFYEECCRAAVMPTTTAEFKIEADVQLKPGEELLIACEITPEGKKAARGNTWMFQHTRNGLKLVCSTTAIQLRAVGDAMESNEERPFSRKKNYGITWHDHIDFLQDRTYHELVTSSYADPEDRLEIGEQLMLNEQAAAILIERAMTQPVAKRDDAAPHLAVFHDWISNFLGSDWHQSLLKDVKTEAQKDELLQKSVGSGVEGQMLARVGKHLRVILSGETPSLPLLLEDDLLNRFYMDGPLEASNVQAAEFVRLLAQNEPHMAILEIGAGTGGTTGHVLTALEAHGEVLLDKYTYTDISAGFFEHAATKFSKWSRYLEFKALDISRDPMDQQFEVGAYDLVVASNVLHATPSIAVTLANVRKLLKPGGRLVLVELTRATVAEGMIFGTLSGWWASEDGRKGSPCLSRDGWREALRHASFDGIEFASYDHDGRLPRTSVIISRAGQGKKNGTQATAPSAHEVCILTQHSTNAASLLHHDLVRTFQDRGVSCSVKQIGSIAAVDITLEGTIYVVLDCLEDPVLLNPSADVFENIRALLITPGTRICWVSYHESPGSEVAAMTGLATGAARSIRRENEGMRFITLDIHDILRPDIIPTAVEHIAKVVTTCLLPANQVDQIGDSEFSLRQGRLMVPRLHTDEEFNHWADRLNTEDLIETTPFQGSDPLKLDVRTPGLLNSLCFTHDPRPALPLPEDEIQVEAKAFGVNFRDVFIALGQMPPTRPMAGEMAGVVTAVGSGDLVQKTYKVGDRVIGLLGPAYSSYTRMKGLHCQKLPDSVGMIEGASIHTVFLTAYYGLLETARLEKGQSILIHSASGGVGQAAIQIAQHIGATIYATVGSTEKREFVVNEYGIPKEHILSSRATPRSIKNKIMQLTANQGVNVVINSMAGEMLAESWECLAPLGVHIELGKADIYKKNSLSMAPFDRNLTFAAIDLTVLLETIPEKMFRLLGRILELFDQGVFTPVKPLNVLPLDQIESAFRLIAERKHMGKVILEVPDGVKVNALLQPPPPLKLAQEGTYLVAGGLGDLGRRISHLLAKHGAGHVVTLSRRSLDAAVLRELEDQVHKLGGKLHVLKCDITDMDSVQRVKDYCGSLPPVRGIIHGGMVLRDRPFANMELEDWKVALGPKVTGTINLDNTFFSDALDFFIALTSVSGVAGRLAQSNYSAANNFQDAYMHERNDQTNTRYFAISLGAVAGSNSITSMTASRAQKELIESASMSLAELDQVLQYAMDLGTNPTCAQTAMGFDRKTLLDQDPHARANSFFSKLPYLETASNTSKQDSGATRDVASALRDAASVDEAAEVISQAISEKLVAFINRDIEDISFNMPLSSFGIDSLISIELKNWIMRTFSANLQASELNGPASIRELSRTLAGRSALVNQEGKDGAAPGKEMVRPDGGHKTKPIERQRKEPTQGHGYKCCKQFDEVPRQPIPDLDETMQDHLQNALHFAADEEEEESFRIAIKELTAPGSVGRQIYERLAREVADPAIENWSSEYLLKAIHLKWRQGLPYSSFMLLQHEPQLPHSQAERAAIIAATAYDYRQGLERGEVLGKWMMEIPQCNHLQEWLFNSVREPAVGCDMSRKYVGDDVAVLRQGRLFSVPLTIDGKRLSLEELRSVFECILKQGEANGRGAGILTVDNRDSWAKRRQDLLELDAQNTDYLYAIESATLVICLDDSNPETLAEQTSQAMLSNCENRWWDKPMQFVVAANGKSSVILEHSRVDGVTALNLLYLLHDNIQSFMPALNNSVNGHHSFTPVARELTLVTNPAIEAYIFALQQNQTETLAQRDFITHTTSHLSKPFLIAHSMPIKGIIEATVQLASRLYHGFNPESWEGVSLSHYHKGRHDMIQTVSPSVLAFTSSALDPSASLFHRREALLAAAEDMSSNVKKAMAGKGYFRLLNVIKDLWPEEKERARYFDHPVTKKIGGYSMVVTMLDPVAPGAGAVPGNPGAVRIRWGIGEQGVTFGVIGPKRKVQEWKGALDRACQIVRELILVER